MEYGKTEHGIYAAVSINGILEVIRRWDDDDVIGFIKEILCDFEAGEMGDLLTWLQDYNE